MKYKILFISSWYPNRLEPTNGNFVQRHAEAVANLHDVEVLHAIGDFALEDTFFFDDKIINGVRTLIVYYKNSRFPPLNFIRRMQAYQKGFSRMKTPDLVHGNILNNNLLFALYLRFSRKIPYVVSEHWNLFLDIHHYKLGLIKKQTALLIAKYATFVLPVSQNLKNGLKKLGVKTQLKAIGNVVNEELFSLKTKNEKQEFRFLHISNLHPLKRAERIVKATIKLREKYNNFSLSIGGDGDTSAIDELIKKYNAESYIATFGKLTIEEVAGKMKQANAFILFSEYESQPCVLLESFAVGNPVIATDVGGVSEIVNARNGILIPNGDDEALRSAMENILCNNVQFDSAEDIRQFCIDGFSKAKIAQRFSEIYKEVLNR